MLRGGFHLRLGEPALRTSGVNGVNAVGVWVPELEAWPSEAWGFIATAILARNDYF